ncbi:MAG: NADPH-ferredoxin reductase FprA [Anaerolineales bacterium]|nr:NADPH-ferredoxin reductase FprA [Anaerolineales bacterium]
MYETYTRAARLVRAFDIGYNPFCISLSQGKPGGIVTDQFNVAVIGAGPAGLFGARELAQAGAQVVLFNRDIKPGGLAEYGIYLDKYTMKNGLRKQFRQIMDLPNLDYCGNVVIGKDGDLTLVDLRALGFQAILVTAGAQGTKWLGLPGENLTGVYHAKDVVYHYNHLPPYSEQSFRFGKRCAVIGAGNVMLDITHFLSRVQKVDEVIAIVRRGPAEVKFEKKEMEYVIANLDQAALDEEIQRVTPTMQAVRQDPAESRALILQALPKALPKTSDTRFRFIFLASPVQMLGENGLLTQVEIEDNILVEKDGDTKAKGTGNKRTLDVETVIFAIGDKVDESFGLPVEWNEFVKNPNPRFPVDGHSYESPFEDVFVGGWSRKASEGLVGVARKDGTNASKAVWQYLQTKQPGASNAEAVAAKLKSLGKPVVLKEHVKKLEAIELEEAKKRGIEEFKFDSNEDMLKAIGLI